MRKWWWALFQCLIAFFFFSIPSATNHRCWTSLLNNLSLLTDFLTHKQLLFSAHFSTTLKCYLIKSITVTSNWEISTLLPRQINSHAVMQWAGTISGAFKKTQKMLRMLTRAHKCKKNCFVKWGQTDLLGDDGDGDSLRDGLDVVAVDGVSGTFLLKPEHSHE